MHKLQNQTPQNPVQNRRRLFIQIVTGCVVLSYPTFAFWDKPEILFAPIDSLYRLGRVYMYLWFLKPVGFAAWLAVHGLYVLACRWWLHRGSVQAWLFTLLLSLCISIVGAMAVNLTIRFPRQLGLTF